MSPPLQPTVLTPPQTSLNSATPLGHSLGSNLLSFNVGAFGPTTTSKSSLQNQTSSPLQSNYLASFSQQSQAPAEQFITPNYAGSAIMQLLKLNLTLHLKHQVFDECCKETECYNA